MPLLKHVHHMVRHVSIGRIAGARGQRMPLHHERRKLGQAHGRGRGSPRLGSPLRCRAAGMHRWLPVSPGWLRTARIYQSGCHNPTTLGWYTVSDIGRQLQKRRVPICSPLALWQQDMNPAGKGSALSLCGRCSGVLLDHAEKCKCLQSVLQRLLRRSAYTFSAGWEAGLQLLRKLLRLLKEKSVARGIEGPQ